MKKFFNHKAWGETVPMELNLSYYMHNRTLAVSLYEKESGEEYGMLTCCLDDAPGRNRAFLDVNNMGEQIVDELETAGFGKRTGRTARSGFVTYPEFKFDAEVLKAYMNSQYEQYLKWQDALKEDEVYLIASCRVCQNQFPLIVKRAAAVKYQEYQEGARYLIQDIFPELTAGERGLLARGQNMCGTCYQKMFGME